MIRDEIERHVCINGNGAIEHQSILDRGAWSPEEKERLLTLIEDHIVPEAKDEVIDWVGVWREWDADNTQPAAKAIVARNTFQR